MKKLLITLLGSLTAAAALASPNGIGAPGGKRTGPASVPPAPITALTLGPKGERALVGDARGRVRRFGLSPLRGESLGAMPGAVTGLAWTKTAMAAIDDEGSVAWIGTSVQVVGRHAPGARALALRDADGLLFTGGDDGTIRLWKQGAASSEARVLKAHDGPVTGLALFQDKYLLSVGWDGQLKSWKLPRVRAARPRLRKHKRYQAGKREMTHLVVSGDQVVTACFDGELVVWTWERRRFAPTRLPQRTHQEWIRCLTARDGKVVAVGPAEQALLTIDPKAKQVTATRLQAQPPAALALLPAGGGIVGRFDGSVDLIRVGGGK